LDGLRGIAILLVLTDHVQHAIMLRYWRPWCQTGQHGVTLFFVLSGYLITSRLIKGPIDLKRFYIRRFFRLMPTAWTYLAFLFLIHLVTGATVMSSSAAFASLFCYRNFLLSGSDVLTGHFWSLSLEEQFYLVWPPILFFAGAQPSRWIAGLAAIACAGYRWFAWSHYNSNVLNGQSQVRADAPLIGCLLALMMSDPRICAALARTAKFFVIPAAAIFLTCMAEFHWLPPLAECVAIALLTAAAVLAPRSIAAKLLSFKPLMKLGVLSYSIYVWHELFTIFRSPVRLLVVMPLVALGSYYFIEQPCRRIGVRLSSPRAPSNALSVVVSGQQSGQPPLPSCK
jgi:peptidoglycan/LPS O-acetylase OafA/YrhL